MRVVCVVCAFIQNTLDDDSDEGGVEPSRGIRRVNSSPNTSSRQLQSVSGTQRKFRGALPLMRSSSSGSSNSSSNNSSGEESDSGSTTSLDHYPNKKSSGTTTPRRQPPKPQGLPTKQYRPPSGGDLEL